MDFFHSKIPSFSSTILRDFNLGRTDLQKVYRM